ncbi:substrate-binding domain-containing protein [Streptomyces sp. NPDC058357]|uniref:substrate-binding domain-containing protein n=1 Tax=unclassified Streptomyces TaxID=2593676 RepID=UPI00365CD6C5
MIKSARHVVILRQLRLRGTVTTEQLAAELGVSVISIRRDLRELERQGQLRRVHGGATVPRRNARVEGALDVAALGLDPASARPDAALAAIGMVVPAAEYYFSEVIKGASHAARVAGVQLILGVTHYTRSKEVQMVRHMGRLGMDAIIFTPSDHDVSAPEVRALLADPPAPLILLERDCGMLLDTPDVNSVRTDHALGAELAVRHLHGRGKRRLALMTIPNATEPQLKRGFAAAVAALGMDSASIDLGLTEAERGQWAHKPDLFADRFLDLVLKEGADGLVVNPDMHAVTFARALVARGRQVPDDIAIVAYDDEIAHLCEVPTTAVAPPKFDLGANAISLALQRVRAAAEGRRFATVRSTLVPVLKVHSGSQVHAPGTWHPES